MIIAIAIAIVVIFFGVLLRVIGKLGERIDQLEKDFGEYKELNQKKIYKIEEI